VRKGSTSKLTDVVDRAGAELAEELLGAEGPQILDDEGPQVEDVVPAYPISLLDDHHFASQELRLDGRAEAARTSTDN